MSYTKTKAAIGKGLLLQIETGSPLAFVAVGEGLTADPAGKMLTDEATNFESTATEYIATIPDGGEMKFTANRVPTDVGQVAVMDASYVGANAGVAQTFKITAPKAAGQVTIGDSWQFYAIVVEFNPAFKPDKKIMMSGTLRVTGAVTYAQGS